MASFSRVEGHLHNLHPSFDAVERHLKLIKSSLAAAKSPAKGDSEIFKVAERHLHKLPGHFDAAERHLHKLHLSFDAVARRLKLIQVFLIRAKITWSKVFGDFKVAERAWKPLHRTFFRAVLSHPIHEGTNVRVEKAVIGNNRPQTPTKDTPLSSLQQKFRVQKRCG